MYNHFKIVLVVLVNISHYFSIISEVKYQEFYCPNIYSQFLISVQII